MDQELLVNGMHCASCINLITMELEDAGLKDKIKKIKLLEGQNQGVVNLVDVNDEELTKATTAINNLGSYQVIPIAPST